MTAATQSDGEASGEEPMSHEDYLKWSCEQLSELVAAEDKRRAALESKAAYSSSALVVLVGVLAKAVQMAGAQSPTPLLFYFGLVFAVLTLTCAFMATAVGTAPAISPTQYFNQTKEYSVKSRLESLLEHLVKVTQQDRKGLNSKGRWVGWAQFCSYTGSLLFLGALITA